MVRLSKRLRGTRTLAIIDIVRGKVREGEYEFATPHFFEEMANDDLLFADIERVVATGRIRRRFKRDLRGIRYEIVGTAIDQREIAVICRIKETGKLLFITTYALD
jgi:hypothetical protein